MTTTEQRKILLRLIEQAMQDGARYASGQHTLKAC
jgi:hypothetical protein